MSTHTIAILVENHHGALSQVAGLFSSRGYNITSLAVAETEDTTISRMTINVSGDDAILEQIIKQLNRLIDVIKVIDFSESEIVEREMLLALVDASPVERVEILALCTIYGARIASVTPGSLVIEMMGCRKEVAAFVALIKPYGIKEIVRSGTLAIAKTNK